VLLTGRAGIEACRQVGEIASPVADELGACWWTVMHAVERHGRSLVDDPAPVGPVLSLDVDETSFLKANRHHATVYATGRRSPTWCPTASARYSTHVLARTESSKDVTDVVAAAFTHGMSRADDPQLHKHVVIWNRARSVSDGKWRTVDSEAIFKVAAMLSELHHGVLSDLRIGTLGADWEARERKHSAKPRYEITGVPETLKAELSRWAEQIAAHKDHLLAEFKSDQVLGVLEAEGHSVQNAQLRVRRLDERVRQVVEHDSLDAREVLADLAAELDEGGNARAGYAGEIRLPADSRVLRVLPRRAAGFL
jgi:hypothetical protein